MDIDKKFLISLRPHHGLCLSFFEGKGYSEEFIENMNHVTHFLACEDPRVRIVTGTDVICSACPHNFQGICSEDSRVSEMDRKVLDFCHLFPGESLFYSEFATCVQNCILLAGKQSLVCDGCQWEALCHGSLSGSSGAFDTPSDISE